MPQAMADAHAAPHETLMVGRDARDREAARRAGVAYRPEP
jgi:phosphoglycolate phosphatase-like HAD superfamily hydrolase